MATDTKKTKQPDSIAKWIKAQLEDAPALTASPAWELWIKEGFDDSETAKKRFVNNFNTTRSEWKKKAGTGGKRKKRAMPTKPPAATAPKREVELPAIARAFQRGYAIVGRLVARDRELAAALSEVLREIEEGIR